MNRSPASLMKAVAVASLAMMPVGLATCASDEPAPAASSSGGVTGGDFHSLVADPTSPGRVFVGGHTNVSVSDDAGRTWEPVKALDDADAMGWTIGSSAIWVSGHPGLNVSVDGGVTFERRNDGLPDTDVHAFGASGETLYAAGPGLGVVASSDAGASWTVVSSEAGQAFFGRILVDPTDANNLVAADVRDGATASRDGGRTWTLLGTDPAAWVSSPDGLVTLYASGGPTPQRSRDGGATWAPVPVPAGATLLEAAADGTLYAGIHDGRAVTVRVSTDHGATWSDA